ncbi:rod-binding protein [Brassicibacter mesophilus]|uniref:rod-binding protein n=1 Tax=Brassicibacter mesophilus TaxID=745119 RepID=UPI003D1E8EA5
MPIISNTTNTIINTDQMRENSIKRSAEHAKDTNNDKELLKACQDFEEIFVHMLLKEMRSTIPEDGLMEKSTAREIFEDMYDQELANSMSKNNGIGIAKMLYNQMKTK